MLGPGAGRLLLPLLHPITFLFSRKLGLVLSQTGYPLR
jgi:hypothetical protein